MTPGVWVLQVPVIAHPLVLLPGPVGAMVLELRQYFKRIKSEIPRLYIWNQDIWLHHIIGNLNEDIPGVDPQRRF